MPGARVEYLLTVAAMKDGPELRMSLYLAKRTFLVDYASRLLGSREVAEEVVQEAFLKFVPACVERPAQQRTVNYLFRIVHNLALDILRRKRRENVLYGHDAPSWIRPQSEPTPEEALLFCEGVRRSMDMMAELPEEQRVALEMHRFGNYTLEEIAEHLGVSVPTAHRLVRNALATIAFRLDGERACD